MSATAETSLQLAGMHCAACAGIIEQALGRVDGVLGARVSAAAQRATVQWDPSRTRPSELVAAVRRAGYDAAPDASASAAALRRSEYRAALWRLFVAAFCAMQVMMFATPSYVAAAGDLEPDLRQLLAWGSWVLSLPVVLFSAGPFFAAAWAGLRQRRVVMDLPVALGVGVTFVASTGATFAPGGLFGHEVYFDSLTMFVSFLLAGRFLELRARHRAAAALEEAASKQPAVAERVGPDGRVEQVESASLRRGDRVRVAAGAAFPADGRLLEGRTQADESLLSGESLPVAKNAGDDLVGGSVNVGAPVLMEVERAGADTRYEAIVAMMRGALSQRPALAKSADRLAGPFLLGVLLLAAAAAAVWSVIDPPRALAVAVSVLIVTCPCALSLAAPATLVAAAAGLARRGVLVQRLDAIEALAKARQVFFDKTGTLTEDRIVLREVKGLDPALDVRAVAASLAAWSQHPLSRAIAAGAAPSGLGWQAVEELPGQGVRALDDQGREWRLGRAAWAGATDDGEHAVWLARAGTPVGAFAFDEVLRDGAAHTVAALRAEGVAVALLSGDEGARVQRLATRLGIADVVGGATPEGKLAALQQAQARGLPVVMVGDGINDGPVLARADASVAMGQGALVARAQADLVVVSNRLNDITVARATAQQALRIVHQNLAWAAVYNAACIPAALLGWLPPWAAGLGMACSSLAVVLNALRASQPPVQRLTRG